MPPSTSTTSNPSGPAAVGEQKLLPGTGGTQAGAGSPLTGSEVATGTSPHRQMTELPRDELEHLADEFGLDPTRYKTRQELVSAIHDRRQMIAGMERDAMLDVIRWGRRPVTRNASKEQIAQEIARIRTMKFSGLSQRGLLVLARLRGIVALESDPVPLLVKKLKKQEGLFAKLSRKRRSMIASVVANLIGAEESSSDYQFLPSPSSSASAPSMKEEIEEAGLIGGITNRLKKSADSYVNQKLDEIEARIDRKLDEIDRKLSDWRDKEIANRIRILKITLWASVIVGFFSLVYSYVKVYLR